MYLNKILFKISSRLMQYEHLRFLLTGVINTFFGFLIYCLVIYLDFSVRIALLVSMIVGTGFNFLTIGGFVFRKLSIKRAPKFIVCYSFIYLTNLVLFNFIFSLIGNVFLIQLMLIFPMALLSYLLMSRVVFVANKL